MFDAYESSIGTRIRYYRNRAGMTQKTLAEACGITEPAIRNYELGNRIPSYDTLEDIATALNINYYALAEPDLSALAGIMHCFFRMEYAHGLKPVEIDGKTVLVIDSTFHGTSNTYIQQMMNQWLEARKKWDSGEWSIEQYEDWETRYPVVLKEEANAPSEAEVTTIKQTQIRKRSRKSKKAIVNN